MNFTSKTKNGERESRQLAFSHGTRIKKSKYEYMISLHSPCLFISSCIAFWPVFLLIRLNGGECLFRFPYLALHMRNKICLKFCILLSSILYAHRYHLFRNCAIFPCYFILV